MVLNICMAHDATKHLKTLQLFRSEADARKHASKHRWLNPIIKPLCIVLVPEVLKKILWIGSMIHCCQRFVGICKWL